MNFPKSGEIVGKTLGAMEMSYVGSRSERKIHISSCMRKEKAFLHKTEAATDVKSVIFSRQMQVYSWVLCLWTLPRASWFSAEAGRTGPTD